MNAVLAIVGPTASGKTALSLPLAEKLEGEIISMDSRQVYRGMDIGTAKASPAERARIPHHGLDIADPKDRYSAAHFARDARSWMAAIQARGRLPMLVGGTGFFLRALTNPVFEEPPMDPARRRRVRRWLALQDPERLGDWVGRLDPERASLAREGGRHRMGRVIEVALLTGRPLSWWHRHSRPAEEPIDPGIIRLTLEREVLYERINRRAEAMFRGGLLEEVESLLASGVSTDDQAMTGTGYREAAAVIRGESSVEEAVDAVRRATRRYARRQETWFRHQLPSGVFTLDATLPPEEQVARSLEWWEGTGSSTGG